MHRLLQGKFTVGLEVTFHIPQIHPLAIIKHYRTKPSLTHQILKSGDHSNDFARRDTLEELFFHTVNPGENMSSRQPFHLAPDIFYTTILPQRNPLPATFGTQCESHFVTRSFMSGDQFLKIHRGKNITIVNQQAAFLHPVLNILQSSPRFQQHRLVEKRNVPSSTETFPLFRQVVRIDREPFATHRLTSLHRPFRQRFMEKRNQRLRQNIRQRTQPRPQSSPKNKRLLDHPLVLNFKSQISNPNKTPDYRNRPIRSLFLEG